MEERKRKEAEFHSHRERLRKTNEEAYAEITKNKKFYTITRKSRDYIEQWLQAECRGKKVLDYCCGSGELSIKVAGYGGYVVGIDIANESIATCKQRAEELDIEGKTAFYVMDAEQMEFEDNSFDIIICSGVLHHLDVNKAFPELSRVLRPDGKIICGEALGYNPLINWYRRRTPQMRTEWEVDHILTMEEVNIARKHFSKVEINFFHLATIAAVPFRKLSIFNGILNILEKVDDFILRIPGIQKQAWQMIFILSQPVK